MADLYETNISSSATALALKSEDISGFLHHFLHNQSCSSTTATTTTIKARNAYSFSSTLPHPATVSASGVLSSQKDRNRSSRSAIVSHSDYRVRSGISAAGSSAVVNSSTSITFSDQGAYCAADVKEGTGNTFSSIAAPDSEAITLPGREECFPRTIAWTTLVLTVRVLKHRMCPRIQLRLGLLQRGAEQLRSIICQRREGGAG